MPIVSKNRGPVAFIHMRAFAPSTIAVVFELMPPAFTLSQLQQTVEALSGVRLHKQNFRRLVEQQGLVEETGDITAATGGRPARLVRFRREVLLERPAPGLRLRPGRRMTVA